MIDLPNSWADTHGWTASWLLPVLVSALLVGRAIVPASLTMKRGFTSLLVVCALVAVANYLDYGRFRYGTYFNEWDAYHYYVGTKYIGEIGYTHLYEATLLADQETGAVFQSAGHAIRDLGSTGHIDLPTALRAGEHVKQGFSAERWREFVADIDWFKHQLPPERWSLVFDDHGFNGTPPWLAVVQLVTNNLSIRDTPSRWAIILIDPILLLVMLGCVAWAYGIDMALMMTVLIGTHYFLSWGHLKGCVLRTDFAVLSVISACCLKRERYASAGACLAWAGISRVFPVLFAAGPFVLLVTHALTERRLNRDLLRFFQAFAATLAVAMLFALVRLDSVSLMLEWTAKISRHVAEGSHWNVGFSTILDSEVKRGLRVPFDAAFAYFVKPELEMLRTITIWTVRIAVLGPTLYFMRFLRAHDAFTLGFVLVFFLVSPDYYYYLILCVPMLFYADHVGLPAGALGLGSLLLTGALGYLMFEGWPAMQGIDRMFEAHHQTFATTYYLSCGIGLTALHMFALAAVDALRVSVRERDAQTAAMMRK